METLSGPRCVEPASQHFLLSALYLSSSSCDKPRTYANRRRMRCAQLAMPRRHQSTLPHPSTSMNRLKR